MNINLNEGQDNSLTLQITISGELLFTLMMVFLALAFLFVVWACVR